MANRPSTSDSDPRVLGIDLAAQPKGTYACVLQIREKELRATIYPSCDDETLIELGEGCSKVAIDAPLGWPDTFVDSLIAHRDLKPWPPRMGDDFTEVYFRQTDRSVSQDRRPLSVAADKLGVTAMRCAELLREWPSARTIDRSGLSLIVEVYPAAALSRWGLSPDGYKGPRARPGLGKLLDMVQQRLPSLVLTPDDEALARKTDDAFDALIAALVGSAARLGLTDGPPPSSKAAGKIEGWIHIPVRGSLALLATGNAPKPLHAAAALAKQLAKSAPVDRAGYARRIEEVFVPTIDAPTRARVRDDLTDKGGSELASRNGRRPKFNAAHSSAALAANCFGPFLDGELSVPIDRRRFAGEMTLEHECPTGLRGVPPTLDFCAVEPGKRVLGVESKCTEPYGDKSESAQFKPAYATLAESMHPTWRKEMERLIENPLRFRHLNAAQLVKHYLGLKAQYRSESLLLAYIYWEPLNADKFAACTIHRAEIGTFAAGLGDPQVEFLPMSYSALWDRWAKLPELRRHVAALRRRYAVKA